MTYFKTLFKHLGLPVETAEIPKYTSIWLDSGPESKAEPPGYETGVLSTQTERGMCVCPICPLMNS